MTAMILLLFLLWFSVTVSTAMDLQKRIIGGQQCERQYHVRLRGETAAGSSNLCGGSLISNQWILTAAHCLRPGRTMFANLSACAGSPAQEVQITAGAVIFMDKDNNNNNNNNRSHDVMLLQLPSPTDIKPIGLPDCKYRPKIVQVAGHAATTGGPNNERIPCKSDVLRCADIDVVDCEDLKTTLQENFPKVYRVKEYQHWFCGQTPGVDVCYGDSGGGVVYGDKIYGVISFLGDPDNVCRKAAAFMDLCNPQYADWINKTIA